MTELSNIILSNSLYLTPNIYFYNSENQTNQIYIDKKVKQYHQKYQINKDYIYSGSQTDITSTTNKISKKSIFQRKKSSKDLTRQVGRSLQKKQFLFGYKDSTNDSSYTNSTRNTSLSININQQIHDLGRNQEKLQRRMNEQIIRMSQNINKLEYNDFVMLMDVCTVKQELREQKQKIKKMINLVSTQINENKAKSNPELLSSKSLKKNKKPPTKKQKHC